MHQQLGIVAAADQDRVLIGQAHHAQRAHVMGVGPLGLRVDPALRLACSTAAASALLRAGMLCRWAQT